MKYAILSVVLFLCTCGTLCSQTTKLKKNDYAALKLHKGGTVKGEIIEINTTHITVSQNGVETKVDRKQIKSYTSAKSLQELEQSIYRNYSDSYFLLPSARPVGKGNSHYKNYNIFYNQFNIGISDNFSLGAGFESLSLFGGSAPQILFLAPKFSFGSDNSYFSVGTTAFFGGGDDLSVGGLLFTNYTYGTDRKNFTIGVSTAYGGGEFTPVILNLNTLLPISNKVAFVAEAIYFEGEVLFDVGLRIKTPSGIAFDAAVVRPTADIGGVGFPLLGITVPL